MVAEDWGRKKEELLRLLLRPRTSDPIQRIRRRDERRWLGAETSPRRGSTRAMRGRLMH